MTLNQYVAVLLYYSNLLCFKVSGILYATVVIKCSVYSVGIPVIKFTRGYQLMLLGSNYEKHVISPEVRGIRESIILLLTVY